MAVLSSLSQDTLILSSFGGVFILIGFVFIYILIANVRKDIAAKNWPRAFGKLADIEVVKHVQQDRDKSYSTTTSYFCSLSYGYEVDRQPYTVQQSIRAKNKAEAVKISEHHHVGKSISVYYDPDKPEDSRTQVLSPGRNWIWLVGVLAFCGFGGGIIYIGLNFY